jgi:hypothetical protein
MKKEQRQKLYRIDALVSAETKAAILQQSVQARKPIGKYCGMLLAQKIIEFESVSNVVLQSKIKQDAAIGAAQAAARINHQRGDLNGKISRN